MTYFDFVLHYSKWGGFVSNFCLSSFALWEGIYLIADKKLEKYSLLSLEDRKKFIWYKIESLYTFVLIIIIAGFILGTYLNFIYTKNF